MLYLYVSIFQFSGHDVRLTVKFSELRHSYQDILYTCIPLIRQEEKSKNICTYF